jgi:hypothetical protein
MQAFFSVFADWISTPKRDSAPKKLQWSLHPTRQIGRAGLLVSRRRAAPFEG